MRLRQFRTIEFAIPTTSVVAEDADIEGILISSLKIDEKFPFKQAYQDIATELHRNNELEYLQSTHLPIGRSLPVRVVQ